MPLSVESAQRGDRRAIIDVLTTAFHKDPPMLALFPDERRRPQAMRRMYAVDVTPKAVLNGRTLVARDGDDVVGAALAFPPRRKRPLKPLADLLDAPRYVAIFGRRVLQARDLIVALNASHPKEPHIHLLYLGAARTGEGIGAALLTKLGEAADSDGLPIYLEASTPNSARLYRRHGFEDVGQLDHATGQFTLMWREPRIPV